MDNKYNTEFVANEFQTKATYLEKYRPQYHFTPEKYFMNDPNGLVYYEDEYHMMYQYYPRSMDWGNQHWGHAVSKDLINWEHLPIALYPDELGAIYSGCIVVDLNNTSGFFGGNSGLVAIFTHHNKLTRDEFQSIAYSKDRGRTWTKYDGNPVIPKPSDPKDSKYFRDPKVFWFPLLNKWIMVVAGGKVRFYSSTNLKDWIFESINWNEEHSKLNLDTECPDFFELPVDGSKENTKWVLNMGGTHYVIGSFDGKNFVPETDKIILNHGPDSYAAQSWDNMPDGRRIMINCMTSLKLQGFGYSSLVPTYPFKVAMTIPHELKLKKINGKGLRLIQNPISEVEKLRYDKFSINHLKIDGYTEILSGKKGSAFDITAEFAAASTGEFCMAVHKGEFEETVIGYDMEQRELFVDRTKSSNTFRHEQYNKSYRVKLEPIEGNIKIRVLVDWSSVEVYGNDGMEVITALVFPEPSSDGLQVYSKNGTVSLVSLDLYRLKTIWS